MTSNRKKIGFNLLDDEDFKIPYVTDTISNLSSGHIIPTQDKQNLWIIDINGENPIIDQGALDELNRYQTTRGKSKVKISLCRRKIYQITDLEGIFSRFDKVRPLFSHLEVCLPKKHLTTNKIVRVLKGPQRKLWKEVLFLQYDKKNM